MSDDLANSIVAMADDHLWKIIDPLNDIVVYMQRVKMTDGTTFWKVWHATSDHALCLSDSATAVDALLNTFRYHMAMAAKEQKRLPLLDDRHYTVLMNDLPVVEVIAFPLLQHPKSKMLRETLARIMNDPPLIVPVTVN